MGRRHLLVFDYKFDLKDVIILLGDSQSLRFGLVTKRPWTYVRSLSNINGEVQRENVVNNVDKSSLWAP